MSDYATMMAYAMDQLRAEGVPEANLRAAAAHLVGQAQSESSLNPAASHDGGIGYGIYGANGSRLQNMQSWMVANGYPRDSAEGQMRYMAHEAMSNNYAPTRNILMNATPETLAQNTNAVTANFERPAVINNRSGNVLAAYNAYDPTVPAPPMQQAQAVTGAPQPSTSTAPTSSQAPQGGLLASLFGGQSPGTGTGTGQPGGQNQGALGQIAGLFGVPTSGSVGGVNVGLGSGGLNIGGLTLGGGSPVSPAQTAQDSAPSPFIGGVAPATKPGAASLASLQNLYTPKPILGGIV
jgi:hypothetical protein